MAHQNDHSGIISAMREHVLQSYQTAIAANREGFIQGDDMATSEYIYPNQMEDAINIVNMFYYKKCRVISIQKKTKIGADGLMIAIATLITTHIDDKFVVNRNNVRFFTGMSNTDWEKDMIRKAPSCFKDKIFHHGKLKRLSKKELQNISNSLIIIDEIDTGTAEGSVLHNLLKDSGILDVKHMEEHNNLFLFISATMIKELYALYSWGGLHERYKMTIPASYIGHKDFLHMEIIQDYYDLGNRENADRWVREDIIENYGNDYRVHIVRVKGDKGKGKGCADMVQDACIRKGVLFKNHTSKDRLSPEEISSLFKEPLKQHIVLGIKGLFRRANLIPNSWKLRIGATHELWTKTIDNNVQIQGLPGRMSGYWRDVIEGRHKTGPYRTSRKAIEEYENAYENPFGANDYQSSGFKKKKGKVFAKPTMLAAKNIPNLNPVNFPVVEDKTDEKLYRIYKSEETMRCVLLELFKHPYNHTFSKNKEGFIIATITTNQTVLKLCDAIKAVDTTAGLKHVDARKKPAPRRVWPCYKDTKDKSTLYFLVLVDPQTVSQEELKNVDAKYPEHIIIQ
jgi:hypothetical protein